MRNPTLRHARHPVRLLGAVVAVAGLAGCGGVTSPSSNGGGGAGGGTTAITVTAHNFGFDPTVLSVPAGSTVTLTFVNTGTVTHNVTAATVNVNLDSAAGATQTATFIAPQSGAIAFHCQYHPTLMNGTITVGSATPPPSSAPASSTGGYGY